MSSKLEKEKYEDVLDYGILREDPLNLKAVILSYANFSKSEKFIYDCREKMPFHERHPLYQSILRNEFTGLIRNNIKNKFPTHLAILLIKKNQNSFIYTQDLGINQKY